MNPLMPNSAPGFRVALFIVAFSLLASSVDRAANTTFVGGQAGDSANGTRLLLSQGEEVSSSVAVSLSDAIIQRASRGGQVFGSFNLSAYAFPDYSGGRAGSIEFGSIRCTPSSFLVLDIANFTLDAAGDDGRRVVQRAVPIKSDKIKLSGADHGGSQFHCCDCGFLSVVRYASGITSFKKWARSLGKCDCNCKFSAVAGCKH
jgi:hypothetical protein